MSTFILVVSTALTRLHGVAMTGPGARRVHAYLGVPYAQAPDGQRRFGPPQPLRTMPSDYDATSVCARSLVHIV